MVGAGNQKALELGGIAMDAVEDAPQEDRSLRIIFGSNKDCRMLRLGAQSSAAGKPKFQLKSSLAVEEKRLLNWSSRIRILVDEHTSSVQHVVVEGSVHSLERYASRILRMPLLAFAQASVCI